MHVSGPNTVAECLYQQEYRQRLLAAAGHFQNVPAAVPEILFKLNKIFKRFSDEVIDRMINT